MHLNFYISTLWTFSHPSPHKGHHCQQLLHFPHLFWKVGWSQLTEWEADNCSRDTKQQQINSIRNIISVLPDQIEVRSIVDQPTHFLSFWKSSFCLETRPLEIVTALNSLCLSTIHSRRVVTSLLLHKRCFSCFFHMEWNFLAPLTDNSNNIRHPLRSTPTPT